MAIPFTPEQQQAIDLKNRNILVSAAAGSGKTAVLVERIVKMVCDGDHPVDIDRLLIVTFTNAAAAEMRERISFGIADRLAANPGSEHIQRQFTLLHNAQITTIHSFCTFLIRNHFNEIGLDPAFRIADEGEMKLLNEEVMGRLMEERFKEKEEDFLYCVEYFCPGGKEGVLEQYIRELHQYAESHPWPEEWLLARKLDYGGETEDGGTNSIEEDIDNGGIKGEDAKNTMDGACQDVVRIIGSDGEAYLRTHIKNMLEGCRESMAYVQQLCQEPDGPYMYGEIIDQELDMLHCLCELSSLDEYIAKLPTVVFGRLSSKKDESVSVEKRDLAKDIRQKVKDIVKDMGERFFTTPISLAARQAGECGGPIRTLIDLVLEYGRRIREKKQEKRLLDYADMEHYALDILLKKEEGAIHLSQVAKEYRQYFHEILIDEYQDSNLVQEYLLTAISGEGEKKHNRFMVGDVKQSIYKFRLARPEIFLEKYGYYTQEDSPCQRIDLTSNFRSREEVVDTVNDVFSRIMSREMGGIDYDEKAALYPAASYPLNSSCGSELLLVVQQEDAESEMPRGEAEAFAIALRIKELREQFQVTDKGSGQLRPVRFSDIVILLRTTSGWDEVFKRILEEEGIPVHITSKTGYFAATEVQELLQFLRVLDNPMQDIPIYGVMKSLFGGFTEEEIALLKSEGWREEVLSGKENPRSTENNSIRISLYDAVLSFAKKTWNYENDPEKEGRYLSILSNKCKKLLETISRYRSYTVYMPIRELLQEIVKDFDYLPYVSALPAGSKRRANVEMLFTKASDFGKTSYFGLFHFIRYIEQLEKYDQDFGEAELLDENADVVRIMSIHKSKGLEFPIVFIGGLSKRFNMQELNRAMVVDMDLGLGIDYVNPTRRIRNKTLRRNVITRKMREDILGEELRILYVAMTRAKEKMILAGVTSNRKSMLSRKEEKLTFSEYMTAANYLDFLLPIIEQTSMEKRMIHVLEFSASRGKEQIGLFDRKERLQRAREYMDTGALKQLEESFHSSYPWKALENLYTKTTVSELKFSTMSGKMEMRQSSGIGKGYFIEEESAMEAANQLFEEKEVVPYIPAFRREQEKADGAVRGNAYHRVMELIDFSLISQDESNLHKFLEKEKAEGRLSREYYDAVEPVKLKHFLKSDIARRMLQADTENNLFREQPFVYGISAGRLGEEFPVQEKVLIQGIVDVFFIEDGQLVLVDYKTDVVHAPGELWDKYEVQLAYYEEALCKLTGLPMKEKLIYSFYLEQVVGC